MQDSVQSRKQLKKSTHSNQYKGIHYATLDDFCRGANKRHTSWWQSCMLCLCYKGAYMMFAPAMQQREFPSVYPHDLWRQVVSLFRGRLLWWSPTSSAPSMYVQCFDCHSLHCCQSVCTFKCPYHCRAVHAQ